MPQELINHNPDLQRLKEEGYALEIREGHLLAHEIPYVDAKRQIRYGILVSDLTSLAGDKTVSPIAQHVAYFIGEHPCNSDGSLITGIQYSSQDQTLGKNLVVNHSFSNKPVGGYVDYYAKMTNYANIISAQAKAIDDTVTEKPFTLIKSEERKTVFNYYDTNTVKAKIAVASSRLENHKLAIIGSGGTASYILDFTAKTPVEEIHLFDGDVFLQHNAFRSPGAPSLEELRQVQKKANYFQTIYAKMRTGIYAHAYDITAENVDELSGMNFVFIAIDKGPIKKIIIDHLTTKQIPFIDVGIGVQLADDSLLGHVRVTTSTPEKREHIKDRIPLSEDRAVNDYDTNIQIADLNGLNAALAVIKWKKITGFYQDFGKECNTTYSINDGILCNDDHMA